ncbi:TetR/AcrR family transcriptional regulator [Plantactinospora sp. WMMC1484]|uniref:TetR/AcrR family transcriptional regulator n=1 Tax=Plantactinospora sp. WMMC1484 TaxID=3404122 RepID=UPI003BF46F2C
MTDDSASTGYMSRKRDAAATKQAILHAARTVFTQSGYDGAGVREIAGLAGVDPRLIGRYFGSKEQLFTRVVEDAYADHLMMTPETNAEAARALLSDPTAAHAAGMLLTLRSASNERAATIMRDSLERNFQRVLADELAGPDAAARAALLVAVCTGVQFMRNVLRSSELVNGDAGTLAVYLRAALDAIAAAPSAPAAE